MTSRRVTERGDNTDGGRAIRLVMGALWLSLVAFATFVLVVTSSIAGGGLSDEASTAAEARRAASYWVFTGAVAAAGPLGIWFFRRHFIWLLLGLVLLLAGAMAALALYSKGDMRSSLRWESWTDIGSSGWRLLVDTFHPGLSFIAGLQADELPVYSEKCSF